MQGLYQHVVETLLKRKKTILLAPNYQDSLSWVFQINTDIHLK